MPLISKGGRKHWRSRLALTVLYGLLSLGALTTLVPFILMAATGLTGAIDQDENRIVPSYFTDRDMLSKKYQADKYFGDASLQQWMVTRASAPLADPDAYERFLKSLGPTEWITAFRTPPSQATSRLAQQYQGWLKGRYSTIKALNRDYLEENVAFQTVVPPSEGFERMDWKPMPGKKWEDWLVFKQTLPVEFRIPVDVHRAYSAYVKGKFQGQWEDVPAEVKGSAPSFETLSFSPTTAVGAEFQSKAHRLLAAKVDPEKTWGGPLPQVAYDAWKLNQSQGQVKAEFATRNYRYVLDYIALNGRALWNTAIFCLLAVLAQLIVNPLAAYALSRYPMPATGKILLFLLATMAFPAEVALIPSFLLLKDLHLLNTFWALVLPGAASGYMIYLLKGFFDSLPQEVFESGQIDGASEATLLTKVALPLSRPVLGYLALIAFMGAYGTFMYAFLVVQDRSMWTLMVFIYQLQNFAPKSVIMAALTLAAIPTIIVFLFSQKTIMRGIVLPGER